MIHRYDRNHWVPGDAHRDGSQPFPAHPADGNFFNDVSGAVGTAEDAVVDDLARLHMQQGSLPRLLPTPFDWHGLMQRIRASAVKGPKATLPLLDALLQPDESLVTRPRGPWAADVVRDAGRLAVSFLRATGQMDYLRRQAWFVHGTHMAGLELAVQWGVGNDYLQFHKDTEGEELFVNLLFRNDEPVPATEWSVDLQEMPDVKQLRIQRNWPPSLLAEVDEARDALQRQAADRAPVIQGGLLPPDGYSAWVDELIWHAIPVLGHRQRWTHDEVLELLEEPEFSADAYDLMAQIAQTPGTSLADLLTRQGVALSSLSYPVARSLWEAGHHHEDSEWLIDALREDAACIDWSQRPIDVSTATTLHCLDPAKSHGSVLQQPSGMAGRPRVNSQRLSELMAAPGRRAERFMLAVIVRIQPRQ